MLHLVRNTYSYLNWGDFVDETSAARDHPYVQLLPITDKAAAHDDFVKTRLGGIDTTSDPKYALLKDGQKSPISRGERVQHIEGFVSLAHYRFASQALASS